MKGKEMLNARERIVNLNEKLHDMLEILDYRERTAPPNRISAEQESQIIALTKELQQALDNIEPIVKIISDKSFETVYAEGKYSEIDNIIAVLLDSEKKFEEWNNKFL